MHLTASSLGFLGSLLSVYGFVYPHSISQYGSKPIRVDALPADWSASCMGPKLAKRSKDVKFFSGAMGIVLKAPLMARKSIFAAYSKKSFLLGQCHILGLCRFYSKTGSNLRLGRSLG